MLVTTGITSALGFLYWWLAARQFPLAAVGLAAAVIAAMMLAGTIGMLGLAPCSSANCPGTLSARQP